MSGDDCDPCVRFNPLKILKSAADLIVDGMDTLADQRVSEIAASDDLAAGLASKRIIEIADSESTASRLATHRLNEVMVSDELAAELTRVACSHEAVIHDLKEAAAMTRDEMSCLRRQQLHVETVGSKTLKMLQDLTDGSKPSASEVTELQAMLKVGERIWEPVNIESEINKHIKETDLANSLIGMLANRTRQDLIDSPDGLTYQHNRVPSHVTSDIERLLETAHNWSWDSADLQNASGGHALSMLTHWVMHTTGLMDKFMIDDCKLMAFLERVEVTYGRHPYHNNQHAANVLQMMFKLITSTGIYPDIIDSIGMLSCIIAAVVHDLEHTGLTNEFLIATMHPLAIRHNDASPQEQHHVSRASVLMCESQYAFIGEDLWRMVRRAVIPMVLATDMKRHFSVMSEFETGSCGRIDKSMGNITQQMLIKISDMSHLTAPWNEHRLWVEKLEREYFLQGDAEVALGLVVTPFMKRGGKGLSTSQVGFMDVVALPLFRAFSTVFPSCNHILLALQCNYDRWMELDL